MKTWVVGGSGLLGSALTNALATSGAPIFRLSHGLPWTDTVAVQERLDQEIRSFAHAVDGDHWCIIWAAGRGMMMSTSEELVSETAILAYLLKGIGHEKTLSERPGTFVFSSSAGAIYAGSNDEVISEHSIPAPRTPYAEEKLKQEELMLAWGKNQPNVHVLITRLSTLYGPGQSKNKKQGLLSHVARCILKRKPVEIFVPFDTIRDYLHVGDAARDILSTIESIGTASGTTMKIIASEEPTSIAAIIGIFKRVTRLPLKVTTGIGKQAADYPRRLCFRSEVLTDARSKIRTSLHLGIAELFAAERLAYTQGI